MEAISRIINSYEATELLSIGITLYHLCLLQWIYAGDKTHAYRQGRCHQYQSPITRWFLTGCWVLLLLLSLVPSGGIPYLQLLVGVIVANSSLLVLIAGKVSLGDNYSPCFDQYAPMIEIKSGPYAYIRHPIYAGAMGCYLGLVILTNSISLLVAIPCIYFVYRIHAIREEAQFEADGRGRFFPNVPRLMRLLTR